MLTYLVIPNLPDTRLLLASLPRGHDKNNSWGLEQIRVDIPFYY